MELTTAVQEHAARTGDVMPLDALLLDQLLRRDVARGEEHGRRDALRQQRPRGQLALIPGGRPDFGLAQNSPL